MDRYVCMQITLICHKFNRHIFTLLYELIHLVLLLFIKKDIDQYGKPLCAKKCISTHEYVAATYDF